jgi:tetratricopeptide (TPR) repeat protein
VHRVQIDYVGPPLPPPGQQDIAQVAGDMRTRAFAHNAADRHHYAAPMLNDHLVANPGDAEAHYALGVSYQKASQLNDAIAEYQLALRYSNGDSVVANNAIQSLQQLHVLQSPDDRLDFHTLKFKQNGQGLTEGDVIATQDRQSLLANRPPYRASTAPAIAAAPPYSSNLTPVGLKAPPAGSLNAPPLPAASGLRPPITHGSSSNSFANPSAQPSFYDSMQYGSNLFPASAPNLNLEPGF